MVAELGEARYVALTTYKRDGSAAVTPVWITGADGSYRFTTGAAAWKTRRLRRDPRVVVQPSGVRGAVRPDAPRYAGTGTVQSDGAAVERAEAALHAKYGWQFTATKLVDRCKRALRVGTVQDVVVIELSLHPTHEPA